MNSAAVPQAKPNLMMPVAALTLFAVASGLLMSALALSLAPQGLPASLASWLASAYFAGLLLGAMNIEPVVRALGHRQALALFLALLLASVSLLPLMVSEPVWLLSRLLAGFASAGVFVVVESWLLLSGNARQRPRRLALYMTALYGGNAVGQASLQWLDSASLVPMGAAMALLLLALLLPLLTRPPVPRLATHHKLGFKALKRLHRPAVVGCVVAGMVLGPLYGLMPLYLELRPGGSGYTGLWMASLILGGMLVQPLLTSLMAQWRHTLLLALFCLLGGVAALLLSLATTTVGVAVSLLMLGMAAFALYPITVVMACQGQAAFRIVSITELMLLCFSLGSVVGPLVSDWGPNGLMALPVFFALLFGVTGVYLMLQPQDSAERWLTEPPTEL
ncbi:MFS transporter [Ferrimonas marina]|uniref:Predicted arabinose efflux permease, MFS family n=1 Tax=Ferrimonas marina TaxID=299255 RepID=A0A1M5RWW8_9GAMM|nr:MFS transporter [Ferrimonas marina]SHH30528.1 Predicted arabinose efflux permease, MFS family [Ferrimonas marina]